MLQIDEPLLRISRLAIHLDRSAAEGESFNRQFQLAPHWGLGEVPSFAHFLAERLAVAPQDVLGWDVMTHDVQPAARTGLNGEFVAGARMDNLATSYAGTRALIAAVDTAPSAPTTQVLVLFDHEEIGSMTERGAFSVLLPTVLERIVTGLGGGREEFHWALAGTVIASGDMAHATHPNYADRHEPDHQIALNGGPVLKVNTNGRYATDSVGAASFAGLRAGRGADAVVRDALRPPVRFDRRPDDLRADRCDHRRLRCTDAVDALGARTRRRR